VTTTPTDSDRVRVGTANPDFTGGMKRSFNYKNFDLNVLGNFSVGNLILLMVKGLRII
jgi:hypothetical protein